MEIQTGGIPWQAEEFDEASALGFEISDEVLVLHFQNPQRQSLPPIVHQPFAGEIFVAAVSQIERKRVDFEKVLEIAGQTGVARVPSTEDNSRRWEQERDKPEAIHI